MLSDSGCLALGGPCGFCFWVSYPAPFDGAYARRPSAIWRVAGEQEPPTHRAETRAIKREPERRHRRRAVVRRLARLYYREG